MECHYCLDTGYIDSGYTTELILGRDGKMLKLDKPVPVQIPCQRCDDRDE